MVTVSDDIHDQLQQRPDANLAYWCLLRHLERGRGHRIALNVDGEDVSYGRLASCVEFFSSAVPLTKGDVIALLLPDSLGLVSSLLGTVAAGAIAVPISTRLGPADLRELLLRIRPRLIVVDQGTSAMLQDGQEAGAPARIRVNTSWWKGVKSDNLFSLTLKGGGDDLAYCLMTSGTTGAPKLVLSKHNSPLECFRSFERGVVAFDEDERVISSARLAFGYGLLGSLFFSLLNGSTSILSGVPLSPPAFLDAIAVRKPSMVLAQPKFLKNMLEGSLDPLLPVRVVLSAGEPLSASLFRAWESSLATPLLDAMGSTELGHIFIANPLGRARPGKTGLLCPGYEAQVRDADGREVGPGEIGELYARGPAMTPGYLNDPVLTSELKRSGWICTGDMVSRDDQGFFQVHGRADDLIKAGCGEWIIPGELEAVALETGELTECAVVAQQDQRGLSVIACFYVPHREDVRVGADVIEHGIQAAISTRWPLEDFRRIDHFVQCDYLPRSTNGKISRAALRHKLRELLDQSIGPRSIDPITVPTRT